MRILCICSILIHFINEQMYYSYTQLLPSSVSKCSVCHITELLIYWKAMITDVAPKKITYYSAKKVLSMSMKLWEIGGNSNIVAFCLAGWGCRLSASNWNWLPYWTESKATWSFDTKFFTILIYLQFLVDAFVKTLFSWTKMRK